MKKALGVAAAGMLAVAVVVMPIALSGSAPAAEPSGGSGLLRTEAVPAAYRDDVLEAGSRCELVTAPVIAAQLDAESGWNPDAISPVGAQGIAQFMPGTWSEWGTDYSGDGKADPFDPTDAIGSQADYMCHLAEFVAAELAAGRTSGDPLQLTLAAYNAGPGSLTADGIPPYPETQSYVQRILGGIALYSGAPSGTDAGGGPPVSADGTYRQPRSGSGRLDPSNLCQVGHAPAGTVLRCDAAQALDALSAAYRARFGANLAITDAYRDYAGQVAVYAAKPGLAAKPGTSNHGWGLAVDLGNVSSEASPQYQWLRVNAPTYGWQHPSWARSTGSKPEAWHWEYVGTPGGSNS